MKKAFTLLLATLFTVSLSAIEIKGRITDLNSKKIIEFATISLLKTDSVYVAGGQSDASGNFLIKDQIPPQDYLLKVTYIGYQTSYIAINNLTVDIDLGDIELIEAAYALSEVSVTGNHIIHKVDRQIIMPTQMQVKNSVNGFDLLHNMSLARLIIDPVNRNIKMGNEDVQLRINGVRSSVNEVVSLRPQDIVRIEYFEDPGVRYANENVGAVINYIVERQKQMGGYLSVDAQNGLTTGFGNDNVAFKLNNKASEFGVSYYLTYRDYDDIWTDKTETFNFPGNPITREQKGLKEIGRSQHHLTNLSYNLTAVDKYVFNVALRSMFSKYNWRSASNNTYSNSGDQTFIWEDPKENNNTHSLDVYYRRELKNKQSITANVVGTYISSDNKTQYTESKNGIPVTDIYNKVDGSKYSLISEAIYEKQFNNIVFSAGGKHTQGYANNKYTGSTLAKSNMRNADTYLFAQMQGKIANKKLSYNLGVGLSRVWFKESDKDAEYYIFRPSVQLSYPVNDNFTLKYSFRISPSIPSLGQLSNVEQRVDSFSVNRGNPRLEPYNSYLNRIDFLYNKGRVNASLQLSYNYHDKPFFRTFALEGDKIYSSSQNQRLIHFLSSYLNVRVILIKDIWTVNGWANMSRNINKGYDFVHTYNRINCGIQSNVMYKNYSLALSYNARSKYLWGEEIYDREDWHYVEAGYKHKEAKLSVGITHPLNSYASDKTENISKLKPSKSSLNYGGTGQMIYLRFSWNMSFGRKHKAGQKTLNNADSDKGIL